MASTDPLSRPGSGGRLSWRTARYPHEPAGLRLMPDEVHLWRAGLSLTAPVIRRLRQSLDADERERAVRFVFEHTRTRYVAAHGLLRYILGCYLKTSPERVEFRYGPRGKPYLAAGTGDVPFRFSLAHSEGLALVAVTQRREVGVDLERIRPGRDFTGIGEHFFSSDEVALLRRLLPEARADAFYNCWTRKEAYVKARGDGLALPLDSFGVSLGPGEPAALVHSAMGAEEVKRWDLLGFTPAPGYVAALAVEGGIRRPACWTLEIPPQGPSPMDRLHSRRRRQVLD